MNNTEINQSKDRQVKNIDINDIIYLAFIIVTSIAWALLLLFDKFILAAVAFVLFTLVSVIKMRFMYLNLSIILVMFLANSIYAYEHDKMLKTPLNDEQIKAITEEERSCLESGEVLTNASLKRAKKCVEENKLRQHQKQLLKQTENNKKWSVIKHGNTHRKHPSILPNHGQGERSLRGV